MTGGTEAGSPHRLGVGVDVSSVERVAELVRSQPRFVEKYFTAAEAAYCLGRPERLTARWAAKEAVRKLFGSLGWRIPLYVEISVRRRPGGAPEALIRGEPVAGLELSLSHDAGVGVAVAVMASEALRQPLSVPWPADLALPVRPVDGHKGTFGTVLVIAGSRSFPGAAVLCALGALRGGAGKVQAVTLDPASAAFPPELIRLAVSDGGEGLGAAAIIQVRPQLQAATAVVCGPGLGLSAATGELLSELFRAAEQMSFKLVLDADALNACARERQLLERIPQGAVLTPHPLEAARLAGMELAQIQADREGQARALAQSLGTVLVLKGAGTVVADPRGKCWTDQHATAALAAGGSGDVLAGLVGALLAQGMDAPGGARAAVYLHGEAGTRLGLRRGRAGILASEVASELVETAEALRRTQPGRGGVTPP
ncbi:MAG: NAD(P)H-hydrate dehydratase [Candidatus Dormibacteria bacterium]